MDPHAARPVAFEVSRSGRRIGVAGLRGKLGVLTAFLHAASREYGQELMLDVGALDSESREIATWVRRSLKIGDEVQIRIIESLKSSRATSRLALPDAERKQEQAWLRRTAGKYGYKLVKDPASRR